MLNYFFVDVLAVYLISVVSQNMVLTMTHEPTAPAYAWLQWSLAENLVVLMVLGYKYVCVWHFPDTCRHINVPAPVAQATRALQVVLQE